MPIGVVSDDDFLSELKRLNPSTPSPTSSVDDVVVPHTTIDSPTARPTILDIERPGRKDGDVNVPDSLRQIIGEEAVINGRKAALGLAGMFGISNSQVSAYAKGATSTASYDSPKPSIIQHINKSRARAIKKAQVTLNGALTAITQDKLDYADPKDLASIAKDMTVVIKNLEPPQAPTDSNSNTPQFTIFAPTFRDERSFESIVVKE